MFYDHLNEYTDSFLEEHDFSREETRQGVLEVAKRMGPYKQQLKFWMKKSKNYPEHFRL